MKLLVLACLAVLGVAHAADGYFDSNGVRIRYVVAGEGEPVVLVHGWMADSSMWGSDSFGNTKLTPAPGFQVIALDCRGHGKSDKPHDPSKYGAEMAEDVVRLMDHLKIKKAHLIGYSMGAFIVGKVAAEHPSRVLSLIYGGQCPLVVGLHEAGASEIDIFAKAVDEGKGLGPYILAVSPPEKKLTLEQANLIANMLYGKKDVKAFALAGKSFKGLEVTMEALAKCKAPTLFIYGNLDASSTQTAVAAMRKVLSNTELKVVEGADHVTTLAKPEFGASIVKFLNAHKAG